MKYKINGVDGGQQILFSCYFSFSLFVLSLLFPIAEVCEAAGADTAGGFLASDFRKAI